MTVQDQLRWGGIVAMATGILMVVGSALRGFSLAPALGQWAIFAYVILLFFVFTTIYAAQTPRIGWIGLAGFVLAIVGLGFTEVIAFLILAGFSGLPAAHEVQMFAWSQIPILHLAILFNTAGGILLGLGTIRAGVFPRWTGAALIIASVANFGIEYFLPRPALLVVPALFFAVAFIGMGWLLWSGNKRLALKPRLAS